MKVSLKIEKFPDISDRNKASIMLHIGLNSALAIMNELIRDAALDIDAKAAAHDYHLASWFVHVNVDVTELNKSMREGDRTAFQVVYKDQACVLRVNVRKNGKLIHCEEFHCFDGVRRVTFN